MGIFDPTYTDWAGLQGGIEENGDKLFLKVQDHHETFSPYNNSSDIYVDNIKNYVNIYDGLYHNVMFGWKNSGTAFANVLSAYHSFGIIGVDNFIFAPTTTSSVSGKTTPLSFVYNLGGSATRWAFGGYYSTAASVTSTLLSDVYALTKNYNGSIDNIVIWDVMLSGSSNATLQNPNAVYQNPGSFWQAAAQGEYPLTGLTLKSISSNVVAYFDFKRENVGSITSKDIAGTTISGSQTAPTTGHTLFLYGGNIAGQESYVVYDVANNNQTIHFPNGLLQFVDENGNIRNIGTIFYEFGILVFDNEYIVGSNSGLPLLATLPISGFGFTSVTSINVNYISFDSTRIAERLVCLTKAEDVEFNSTQNKTGIIQQTGDQLLKNSQATYVTTVGLYNALDDLVAIGKTNKPIKKDDDHVVSINVNLDF